LARALIASASASAVVRAASASPSSLELDGVKTRGADLATDGEREVPGLAKDRQQHEGAVPGHDLELRLVAGALARDEQRLVRRGRSRTASESLFRAWA